MGVDRTPGRGDELVLRPGCKVNLYLRITGLRPDGYHDLETLFFPLDKPCDVLRLRPGSAGSGLVLTCDRPELAGAGNLVAKAHAAFTATTGLRLDLACRLEKGTPMAAGLGGGSADAAAMLTALNALAGNAALSDEALAKVAAGLGADVPFFLLGRPAWATGKGEVLRPVSEPLTALMGATLVLACPSVAVSTAWAYKAWDERVGVGGVAETKGADESFLTISRREDNVTGRTWNGVLCNSFEDAVFPAFPELRLLKERFLRSGAAGALLSGSGSSVFAVFRDPDEAASTAVALRRDGVAVYVRRV